jgi:hypothetical protein
MPSANIRAKARNILGTVQEFGTPFAGGSTRDIRVELPTAPSFIAWNLPRNGMPTLPVEQPKGFCCWKKLAGIVAVAWIVANA